MFSEKEILFLNTELTRFTEKIEERLLSQDLSDQQRVRLESRLVTSASIRRKLEYEKKLKSQKQKRTPHILVIDDMESALQINKQFLSSIGFKKIDTANNGLNGLKKIKEAAGIHHPYGLIICDWEMPKMSGLDLLKKVRADKDLWATPFYLLSSKSEKKDILKAINIGATGYITKPVSPATLTDKLQDYIIN
ncbi:MAG: response regulator [Cellvibrionaceae bacterium]